MTTDTTATDAALLQLIWLASPALPVGGFSYSEGMESAVDAGLVHDEASASAWLAAQLQMTLARSDIAVVAQAMVAWRANDEARVAALDAWVLQTRETAELRQQTEQMGRSMIEWLKSIRPDTAARSVSPPTYPVAFALAASESSASARDAAMAFAFGWAENMMQAAIKSVPLGQSAGQRILSRLAADIPAAVDHALSLDDDTRQSFSPMLAILSARHETQYSRLFRS
ncbi:urease accessory protein UreF [Caenimonas aquaedulcis]|uniref:Urease accessory protein UreF n=1 Tax=Caenimonas aquaedulcis TaxID=2793270 RepID=A0A931MGU6_9BURK|nr:urease accessory UreF family protein [Caenimonas aquaedulcis]MBG9388367.1 urease accessory protein UreF [Caenimonas aquaedulcis]